uniref:Uncharacterized protein n=1 Tax=Arundo donax TaxID=35708 RepID=A0A0A9I2Q4_ARUDO
MTALGARGPTGTSNSSRRRRPCRHSTRWRPSRRRCAPSWSARRRRPPTTRGEQRHQELGSSGSARQASRRS